MVDKNQILASLHEVIESHLQEFLKNTEPVFDITAPRIKLHEPTYGVEEIREALESLLTTKITMGDKVKRFEREFAQSLGIGHALMVNSGSSANLLAMSALSNPVISGRLVPGDEIIVPALSWSTTIWPIIQNNLIPVIVDIDLETLDIDPVQVERAIGPKTRGIMLVHVYGNACDMSAIMNIVKRHNLVLIEDCCEALGSYYDGKPVGSFGRVGTFSFYFSHHVTTLEGGMCVTDDYDLAETMRILRAHGWIRETLRRESYQRLYPDIDPKFLFVNLGYNIRPTELQGGFGYVQLKKLKSFVDIRRDNARYWRAELLRYEEWFALQKETPRSEHSWFGFPMSVRQGAPFSMKEFTQYLNSRGIETRPIIAGNIAVQPAMKHFQHRVIGELKHSTDIMKNGFTFGNHQAINGQAREYVVNVIEDFLKTK
jgi:CDP-6-deoxy-D-xylo-4-hexulose-3-dehydrase